MIFEKIINQINSTESKNTEDHDTVKAQTYVRMLSLYEDLNNFIERRSIYESNMKIERFSHWWHILSYFSCH